MDAKTIGQYADEILGLKLDNSEAEDLAQRVAGLRRLVDPIDRISLPFLEDPFTSPRSADRWIEKWTTS
jgi:hypothetical protein